MSSYYFQPQIEDKLYLFQDQFHNVLDVISLDVAGYFCYHEN